MALRIAKQEEIPSPLKPYIFHGLDLQPSTSDQWLCQCPWCSKHKFYVSSDSGQYQCKVCGDEGNVYSFLNTLWKEGEESLYDDNSLVREKRLLSSDGLLTWGVNRSPITGDYLIPAFNEDTKLVQLYRYRESLGTKVIPTEGLSHGLMGFHPSICNFRKGILLCEGIWDAVSLWEVFTQVEELTDKYDVLATPGANIFNKSWLKLFKDKDVVLLYDNDHPKKNPKTKKLILGAGLSGVKRVAKILGSSPHGKPSSISFLKWGDKDGGWNPHYSDGCDIRDILSGPSSNSFSHTLKERITLLSDVILPLVKPVPQEWLGVGEQIKISPIGASDRLQPSQCNKYTDLTNSFRKALKWTDGLDRALSVMLASVVSTETVGEQIWLRISGQASSGKTTLAEALAVSRHVLAKSNFKGFFSGYKSDKEGNEDHSLIVQCASKTLIIKDGDTLLSRPNLREILSQLRDIYDGAARSSYLNGMGKDYVGVRMTVIICGTSALHELDTSELGERCLECSVGNMGMDMEREVCKRIFWRDFNNLKLTTNGEISTHYSDELREAMCKCGGYVDYLRSNGARLVREITVSEDIADRIADLSMFVAYMRAKPSDKQMERSERELAFRLSSQLTRLAGFLPVVMNKESVDSEVVERVRNVALDTAQGITLSIISKLYDEADKGSPASSLSVWADIKKDKCEERLRFLKKIGAVECFTKRITKIVTKEWWRLTTDLRELYKRVMCLS